MSFTYFFNLKYYLKKYMIKNISIEDYKNITSDIILETLNKDNIEYFKQFQYLFTQEIINKYIILGDINILQNHITFINDITDDIAYQHNNFKYFKLFPKRLSIEIWRQAENDRNTRFIETLIVEYCELLKNEKI
jgi:hypothetical protein